VKFHYINLEWLKYTRLLNHYERMGLGRGCLPTQPTIGVYKLCNSALQLKFDAGPD